MLETVIRRLMSVKSIVTLILTVIFAYLSVVGNIPQDFMTVYVVVISFYFGTQAEKIAKEDAVNSKKIAEDVK